VLRLTVGGKAPIAIGGEEEGLALRKGLSYGRLVLTLTVGGKASIAIGVIIRTEVPLVDGVGVGTERAVVVNGQGWTTGAVAVGAGAGTITIFILPMREELALSLSKGARG
jgi:hypothetical protein